MFEKPFVLFMGPQRAGARVIYDYLRGRRDVCLPAGVQEVFFFDRHFHRGQGFYQDYFPLRTNHAALAEVTTTLFDHPEAPQRVFEVFGRDITLICPLREPVARAYAVYESSARYGIIHGGIEEAVEQMPQILHAGFYARHLARWFEVFGRDAVHIMFYEDMEQDREAYFRGLCDAMDLPYRAFRQKGGFGRVLQSLLKPSAFVKPVMGFEEAKPFLCQKLAQEAGDLEALLDKPLGRWEDTWGRACVYDGISET
ncbi:MAG: sulfotransferase domain-containing protein [Bdellovibrionales bacterium]